MKAMLNCSKVYAVFQKVRYEKRVYNIAVEGIRKDCLYVKQKVA